MSDEEARQLIQAAAQVLMDAVLRGLQADPHQWSDRPCPTCQPISAILGRPFGCYEYQRQCAARRAAKATP